MLIEILFFILKLCKTFFSERQKEVTQNAVRSFDQGSNFDKSPCRDDQDDPTTDSTEKKRRQRRQLARHPAAQGLRAPHWFAGIGGCASAGGALGSREFARSRDLFVGRFFVFPSLFGDDDEVGGGTAGS